VAISKKTTQKGKRSQLSYWELQIPYLVQIGSILNIVLEEKFNQDQKSSLIFLSLEPAIEEPIYPFGSIK
jgi:hypothetical protein